MNEMNPDSPSRESSAQRHVARRARRLAALEKRDAAFTELLRTLRFLPMGEGPTLVSKRLRAKLNRALARSTNKHLHTLPRE